MRRTGPAKPHKRDGVWYLVRRVPAEFAHLDTRTIVRISTEIAIVDDPKGTRAREIVKTLTSELEAYWRGLRDGQSAEARIRFEAAQKRAKALGVPYQTADELRAAGRFDDVMARLEMLIQRGEVENEETVSALLGGEKRPVLHMSELFDEYAAIQEPKLKAMSDKQRHRWGLPKKRAIQNFMDVVGDKALENITRDDALTFRRWWADRIAAGEVQIATANKDFGHLGKMLTTVDMMHHLHLPPVFAKIRFEGETFGQRAAFTVEHVRTKILAPGALDDLNKEASAIVYLVAELGLRPSEACGLRADQIHLDAEIPFIEIKPIDRALKNAQSERDMPLVGYALWAMKQHPQGFPRYRDKADSLSALVNKYLGGRKLLPTEDHSLYSLRHTFEDRLTTIEAPEKLIATLMGHKYARPRYGAGYGLEQKREWLQRIAFTVPEQSSAPA